MKRILLYIGITIFSFSCCEEPFRPATGDLLFQVNPASAMTDAITRSTAGNEALKFSHVAIALRNEGGDSVLEASSAGGVRIVPYADFLNTSAKIDDHPAVLVMRLRDTARVASAAAARARTFLGQPYDYSYLPNNGKMYCSELVWESYLDPDGQRLFRARPMNFRDSEGRLPDFWSKLFGKLGQPVPEGLDGTNPSDLSKDPLLYEVHRYF